jgi:cold shock CspA family protein/ribosome-associated translation inhibitor RaiA
MADGAPDIPVMVTFKDMAPSEAVETRIHGRAQKLSRYHERITACRVVIAEAHRQHQKGTLFHVRIDLTVPDGEIVVNREPEMDHAHEDAYVAIRDAFDAAQRQLQDWVGRHAKHGSKMHPTPRHGTVVRVFADDGFGFIETPDGDEVYFHKNAVTRGGWNKLDVGTAVRFCEADGDKGPHAPSVTLVDEGEFVELPPE